MPKPEIRSETIMVRVTPAEKETIEACAEADRRTVAEWCYLAVIDAARKAKGRS